MAQSLDVVALSESDEENSSQKIGQAQAASSDSDSDSPIPEIKKKRSTQSTFNTNYVLDPLQPSKMFGSMKSVFHSNIYTSCINQEARPEDLLPHCFLGQDREGEINSIFKNKSKDNKTKSRHRKSGRKRYSSSSSSSAGADDKQKTFEIKDYVPQIITLGDASTDVDSDGDANDNSMLSMSQTREPTPPPEDVIPETKQKIKKKVQKAFKKLEKAQLLHDMHEDSDSDIAIMEVVSPIKTNKARDITVKIRTRSGLHRFPIKMTDSFTEIFSEVANREMVSVNQVSMFVNEQRVHAYSTPNSLGLGIADIIECYIRNMEDVVADKDESILDDKNTIVLKVQTKDAKSRLNITIGLDDPLEKLMREFCSKQSIDYDLATFQFDGEDLKSHETPRSIELEDDYCIDVIS